MAAVRPILRLTLNGPFLLTKVAFEDLDAILNEKWKSLSKLRLQEIRRQERHYEAKLLKDLSVTELSDSAKANIKEMVANSHSLGRLDKKVILELHSRNRVTLKSFKEAFDLPVIQDDWITKLTLEVNAGSISCILSVDIESFISNQMEIRADPEDREAAKDLFARLKSWAEEYKPTRLRKVWSNIFGLPFVFLTGFIFIMPMFLMHSDAMFSTPPRPAHTNSIDAVRQKRDTETVKLLQEGVNETNHHKALELILEHEADYNPNTLPASPELPSYEMHNKPVWQSLTFWLPLAAFIVFCYPPRSAIGLTRKGQKSIDWYKKWVEGTRKFLFGTIILGFVVNALYAWWMREIF